MFCLVGSSWVWVTFCRDSKKQVFGFFYSVPDSGVDGESRKQIKSTAKNILQGQSIKKKI